LNGAVLRFIVSFLWLVMLTAIGLSARQYYLIAKLEGDDALRIRGMEDLLTKDGGWLIKKATKGAHMFLWNSVHPRTIGALSTLALVIGVFVTIVFVYGLL
jgi:hypothetical protein